MTERENIIKTEDENGEIHSFELIDIVTVDEQDYGLLIYVNEEDNDEEQEEELVIMRLLEEGEGYTFEMIEDEEEFNKVVEAIDEMVAEEEDDEEE